MTSSYVNALNEDKLLDEVLAGNQTAMQQLLLLRYEALLAYAKMLLSDQGNAVPLDPEDILQEAAMNMLYCLQAKEFRASRRGEVIAWMKTCVYHCFIDHCRKNNLSKKRTEPSDDDWVKDLFSQVAVAKDPTASYVARLQELLRAFELVMAKLPQEYAEVLRLRYLEDVPVEEIAKRIDKTPGAVRAIAGRACERLKLEFGSLSGFL